VIARFVETFFRHKLLILLPIFVTPLVVMPFAFLLVRPYYETTAGVWAERPAYVPITDDASRYVTPAQSQQARLNELLQTRSFLEDIAKRTSLAPLVTSSDPTARENAVIYLQRAIYPLPSGNKLLGIRVRADDPDLAMEIINATLAAFRERAANDRVSAASSATAFYDGQLKNAEDESSKAQDAVRRYITANPRLGDAAAALAGPSQNTNSSTPRVQVPASALDPQLSELAKRLDADEKEVDRLRGLVEQSRFDASAAIDGSDSSLQIVDPPIYPSSAQRERKRFLIFPAAAIAIGGLVSALLLISLTATDRSVRSSADLRNVGRVIGVVPRMGLRKLPRRAGPETTRRAIAFVAGTTMPALPAPRKAS
jgi:uncharacterized protein involved in exopolysaccharide biosynthesis